MIFIIGKTNGSSANLKQYKTIFRQKTIPAKLIKVKRGYDNKKPLLLNKQRASNTISFHYYKEVPAFRLIMSIFHKYFYTPQPSWH
jgi:hypothetical protein